MTMTLDDLLDLGEKHARQILLVDRAETLIAFYHLIPPEPGGPDIVLPCLWQNDIQKQIILATVKKIARDIEAVAVLHVGEAWMVQVAAADQARLDRMDPASQQPGRVEVVWILASDGETTRQRALRIVRDQPGGRIATLEPIEFSMDGTVSGRLIDGILPLKGS